MSLPIEPALHKLQFYVTTPYVCGYLPGKLAQSLIATPHHLVDTNIYSGLIQQGFRRSGKFAYRPHCEHCNACVPVRLVLQTFTPNRSQKRAFKQHTNLSARIMPLGFHGDHFALYSSYQLARHSDVETQTEVNLENEAEQYQQFLCNSHIESLLIEFRDEQHALKMVSIVDIVSNGVSAVYTFYDTTDNKASFGTFAIMWQAQWTSSLKLDYLYLGYWIADSQKMAYKQQFKPQEKLIDGEWI